MPGDPAVHRHAARRHEEAAGNHDRSAMFWEGHGKDEQARLQRRLAEHERHGAELELKWAELVEADSPPDATKNAERAANLTRKNAEHLSSELERSAQALEQTADLAEQHARRHEQAGDVDSAAQERESVARARDFAQRARLQAEEWRKVAAR